MFVDRKEECRYGNCDRKIDGSGNPFLVRRHLKIVPARVKHLEEKAERMTERWPRDPLLCHMAICSLRPLAHLVFLRFG